MPEKANSDTANIRPDFSIIMAARNSGATIGLSIESILNQSHTSFELIIAEDASEDKTAEIVESFDDPRIILLRLSEKKGAAGARNMALKTAKGRYISIFDSDDVAHPDKLRLQFSFLEAHAEIAICGTSARVIDGDGRTIKRFRLAAADKKIRATMLFHNCFIHSTLVFRRELLKEVGGYDEGLRMVEDYDFLLKLLKHRKAKILPNELLDYRMHVSNTMSRLQHQREELDSIIARRVFTDIGLDASEYQIRLHLGLKNRDMFRTTKDLQDSFRWLETLASAALKSGYASRKALSMVVAGRAAKLCLKSRNHAGRVLIACFLTVLLLTKCLWKQ